MGHDYDVVIVGAGALGSCTARDLAEDHTVLLVEKDQVAGKAAGHAAGFFSNWWYYINGIVVPGVDEIIYDFWEEYDGTGNFEFHNDDPFVKFVKSEEKATKWRDLSETLPSHHEYHTYEEIEDRWPNLFNLSQYEGAMVDERAGYFDPYTFVTELADDARDSGAELRTGTAVTDILTDDGEVTGVEIDGEETVTAENVVVTAGTFTRELVSEFVDLPTKSFVYSNVRLRANREIPDEFPMAAAGGMYWRQETQGNLFISGGEYWLEERTRAPRNVPEEFKRDIATKLPDYLDGFEDVRYMSGSEHTCPAGVCITPDAYPVIDELDDPSGLVVVDGVAGEGVSLAPAYAAAIRSLVTGETAPFSLDRFRADRFESPSLDFDYDWIDDWP